MTAERPTPTPAGCSHPDSRIVWEPWIGPTDRGFRLVWDQCSECLAPLSAATLWESEVAR
jgi:hypothetical protein